MRVLEGEDKQIFIDYRVRDLTAQVLGSRPKTFSLRNLDIELISPLLDSLHRNLVLAERDGHKLRLSYLKEE